MSAEPNASDPADRDLAAGSSAGGLQNKQISLRGLLGTTAYFAVASALATRFGIGVLVLLSGIFLTFVNARGYLWWLQTPQGRPRLFAGSWLIFAVSLVLPAFTVTGCGGGGPKTHYGWQAALSTSQMLGAIPQETVNTFSDPNQRTMSGLGKWFLGVVLIAIWNLPNMLMLASPLLLYRQQRGKGGVMSALVACAAASSWTWGLTASSDLRIGYYVWSLGITSLTLSRPPTRGSLTAMVLLGLLWFIASWWS